jgi:hypothetical protein
MKLLLFLPLFFLGQEQQKVEEHNHHHDGGRQRPQITAAGPFATRGRGSIGGQKQDLRRQISHVNKSLPRAGPAAVDNSNRGTSGTTPRPSEALSGDFPLSLPPFEAISALRIREIRCCPPPEKSPLKSFNHAGCVYIPAPARW